MLFEPEPSFAVPSRAGMASVTRRRVKQLLTKATGALQEADFTLNPYVGCSFACEYCYAAFFQPDEAKARDWGYWVEVKENALDLLRAEPRIAGAKVVVGSVTDPYQPVEKTTRLTRSLLEHMASIRPQPTVTILTRSPIAARDTDLLLRFERLKVYMSVTTDDDEVRKRYEPSCASIGRRLEAVQKMAEAGVAMCLGLSPLLPVTDVPKFAQAIRASGAKRIWTGYFHPGTRKFAAGTRPNALTLAKEDGWNFERYLDTVTRLKKLVPELVKER
jgi:DNA repair photolyase